MLKTPQMSSQTLVGYLDCLEQQLDTLRLGKISLNTDHFHLVL